MNADGTNVTNLIDNHLGGSDVGGAWSPDGSQFAFLSDRHLSPTTAQKDVYVANSDGSNATRITDDPMPVWDSSAPVACAQHARGEGRQRGRRSHSTGAGWCLADQIEAVARAAIVVPQ